MAVTGRMSLDAGSGRSLSFLMSHSIFLSLRYSRKELNRSAVYIKMDTREVDSLT